VGASARRWPGLSGEVWVCRAPGVRAPFEFRAGLAKKCRTFTEPDDDSPFKNAVRAQRPNGNDQYSDAPISRRMVVVVYRLRVGGGRKYYRHDRGPVALKKCRRSKRVSESRRAPDVSLRITVTDTDRVGTRRTQKADHRTTVNRSNHVRSLCPNAHGYRIPVTPGQF